MLEPPSMEIWSSSDDTEGVGIMTGDELEVFDTLLFAGGGIGGIFGVDSVLLELSMIWRSKCFL
jgi:hypothetical protein